MTDAALIYAIHRTHAWWRHVGSHLGYGAVTVLTDQRGKGDRWITDDFYRAYRTRYVARDTASALLAKAEIGDVIARCRVLRWKQKRQATAMALAVADAVEKVLTEVRPSMVLSFSIDNYVQDVLARRARAKGIPYYELTASALPGMCMLMHRGRLLMLPEPANPAEVEARVNEISDPEFTPSYVQGQAAYTLSRFIRTLGYFRIRAAFFRLYSWLKTDPLNVHFLDAQPELGHKAKWGDIRLLGMVEADWQAKVDCFPRERRVLFGLQLLPEAAIDYWLDNLGLVHHEDTLVEIATHLTAAGYQIIVKDHPLQFGFRQAALVERLKALKNVVFVPYEISGNELLSMCAVSVTGTGTLGLQAALLGNTSVVCDAYYVASEADFVVLKSRDDIASLAERIKRHKSPPSLYDLRARIIAQLLRASFTADFFSFRNFDPAAENTTVSELGRILGERLRRMGPNGEDWFRYHLPPGSGDHEGSPLR
jgi:hypothetical protein